jgi:cobalt-zinc-cadmium efflux system outer membrane protein
MKRLSFGSLILMAALGGAAQGAQTNSPARDVAPTTLDALVAEALEKNVELKFYEAEIAAAQAGRKTAGLPANPTLGAEVGHNRQRFGGLQAEGVAWSVSLMQPIEWPGRVGLRKAIANSDVALAQLGLEQFRHTLANKVRGLAFELAVAQQRAVAGRGVAERMREITEVLVGRDPAGLTPLLETRVLEAASVKAGHVAAEAEHDVEHLVIQLNYWLGRPSDAPLRVAPAVPRFSPAPSLATLLAAARTNNFDLRARVTELEQQGIRVDLAKNERYPAISVGPSFSDQRAGTEEQRIVGVGVSLPLPLWNRNRAAITAATARQQQAEVLLEATRRQLDRDVTDFRHKYEHALGVLARWRPDAIQHFQEAAELADRHYRLGAVPLGTYVEMQRQYVEAVESILAGQQEALVAAMQLELLTGLSPSLARTTAPEEKP